MRGDKNRSSLGITPSEAKALPEKGSNSSFARQGLNWGLAQQLSQMDSVTNFEKSN
jgi:hypothetical protein